VAATVTVAGAAPRLGILLAVPTVLLTVGVVYCQMHYAVDAVAGVVVAGLALAGALLLERGTPLPSTGRP